MQEESKTGGIGPRPKVSSAKRHFLLIFLITGVSLSLVLTPDSAQARRRRRHHAHRSVDYVAGEGNRAAALEILSSESDPSRLKASSRVGGIELGARGGKSSARGEIVEDLADEGEDADEGSELSQGAAPWDRSGVRGPAQQNAAPAHGLHLKSGVLSSDQVDQLSLQKIQHSLQRQARKRCAKKACNKQLHHYIVQFNERITAEDQLDVTSLGATILRYMPDDAFVIESEAVVAYTIRGSATSVKAVVPFQPRWKLSRELLAAIDGRAAEGDPQLVRVRLFPTEEGRSAASSLEEIPGVRVRSVSGRSLLLELPLHHVLDVAATEAVEWIELQRPNSLLAGAAAEPGHFGDTTSLRAANGAATPGSARGDLAELSGWESGAKLLYAYKAWDKGLNGQGQIIAMADSGLDTGDIHHLPPDLAGRVLEGSVFSQTSNSWADGLGHGTYLAGLIAGNGAGLGGRISGVSPGVKLLPQSIRDGATGNIVIPSRLRDLFFKAYQAGARIHLDAWGSSSRTGEYSMDAQQVDEFAELNPDMLIVFAAGNSGQDADHDGRVDAGSILSPATAKNALTVGAAKNRLKSGAQTGADTRRLRELDSVKALFPAEPLASSRLSDDERGLAPFGSRGPTEDGRIKPELVAPATNLLSLRSRALAPASNPASSSAHEPTRGAAPWIWGSFGDSYVWSGGSSSAAALAASAAAVVRQYLIENRKIKTPSSALVKAVLMHSAFDLFPGEFGEHGAKRGQEILTARPNSDEGFGRLDLGRATDLTDALIVDDHAGVRAGEIHAYKIRISSKTKLSATLVYTDTPAALGAAKSLVNDLDLVLLDKDGHETSINDHVNNFESLTRDLPAGNYQIQVRGFNVPQAPGGKQPYALVVSVD